MLWDVLRGTAHFSDARRAALQAEGVVLEADDAKGTLTYRDYRGPDRRASWRKEGLRVALAVTGRRVAADRRGGPLLDVPFDHPGVAGMTTGVDDGGKLVVAWDCALLRDDTTGRQELRVVLPGAERDRAVALLLARGLGPFAAG
ncbi:hypothetical protein [Conexibacter sp. SYSU D00693]|uniref:hypothetical protein n=1 Tax=Conexibacter sp. SYSU D00693 TaxID=2812560 RepID=UPI00196ABA4A|nr:hypothetical protein [Conexibacter sp. SYSU D00693]